jgi:hypothetical protein
MIHRNLDTLRETLGEIASKTANPPIPKPLGLCGFDGFIDTFIHIESPDTMAAFGPKVAAAAGIATSVPVRHEGDRFGGNGPLLASALHDIWSGHVSTTYIGALGSEGVLPIFGNALEAKTKRLVSLADPAHSDCLEFRDGKVMLSDMRACADVSLERLAERMDPADLDAELLGADFIAAVNWGKLPAVGGIWKHLASRIRELGRKPKEVVFFMDLAEFEHRPQDDVRGLLESLPAITGSCRTILSFNLKEAWQMGDIVGAPFNGRKDHDSVIELARRLKKAIDVDRIVVHPNDCAASADARGECLVPGPVCAHPLVSTGAGDNFGAGLLSGELLGLGPEGSLLTGNCASGHYVRTGRSASFREMITLLDHWRDGSIPERL